MISNLKIELLEWYNALYINFFQLYVEIQFHPVRLIEGV